MQRYLATVPSPTSTKAESCLPCVTTMATRYDYPPGPLSRPTSDVTITDRSTDVDVEMGEESSSDDLEEGDVLITITDEEGRRVADRQQERNVLRKKTTARYPQVRYSALVRQRRWWKNREKHLLLFIAIATIIVNVLAAIAVIIWGVIYQRTP
ncbi:hypothetical protein L226DRAFT_241303 [Lentinus tigrinus ALCF2SS1-7]|uniref:uncharacterized protein n=1 Tax=Lentinus tigrinus ALCF2SS1-7 TaxID=1328758 RepID=UPI001165FF88|nr:hypothetical protein L226DRAFT_241303 [Lentinus tigrinus ALCF2SS1-7]